jgi:acyl-CoA thioesterase YciA
VGKAAHRVKIKCQKLSMMPMSEQSSPVLLPDDKTLVLRVMPMPADVNVNGLATVAVNHFLFKQPVRVGDLLSFYAEVKRIGNTSMTVEVEVYAQRLRPKEEVVKVTEATLTYVAIDANGKPRPVPNRPA